MTKKNMFETLIAIVAANEFIDNRVDLIAGLQHELDLLERKAISPKKPTARQNENKDLQCAIQCLMSDIPMTVSDIIAAIESSDMAKVFPGLTNQRVTHIMTAMKENGVVIREVVKRKAYYRINPNYTACVQAAVNTADKYDAAVAAFDEVFGADDIEG